MTVEIAIMNKEAIALAADSAVTITTEGEHKIFTSANKLFTLSKYQPVGIMIYGNAVFMGVPWETIIKIYRRKLGRKKLKTLKQYANDFIKYLDNGNPLFPETEQVHFIRSHILGYFELIKGGIREAIHKAIDDKGKLSPKQIRKLTSEVIEYHFKKWKECDNIPSIPKSFNAKLIKSNNKFINTSLKGTFEKLPLTKSDRSNLKEIASSLFTKFPKSIDIGHISGIVIAGFGESEFFPSVISYHIEGIAHNKLKFQLKDNLSSTITHSTSALLIPFAQSEMIATFMEGSDPYYRNVEESYLFKILNDFSSEILDNIIKVSTKDKAKLKTKLSKIRKEILKDFIEKTAAFRRQNYSGPITKVVAMLPKNELAEMAESLVNLTSFKRKVTMEKETVGGPIDVAVISKGDGFIWMKRKHYFKPELNTQFFANYQMGEKI